MNDVAGPREAILGSGAGGPLTPPSPWIQYSGYVSYANGVVIGSPTGGNIAPGALNVTDLYVNGTRFVPGSFLALTGGTLTGPLTLAADPTSNLQPATKFYVDSHISSATVTSAQISDASPLGRQLITQATAQQDRTSLGSTTVGDAVFTAASAAAARATLGSSATGDALFTSTGPAAARATLGSTTVGDAVFIAATQTAAQAALGLGSMATQNGNSVNITGGTITGVLVGDGNTANVIVTSGSIDGTTIGATNPSTGVFTTLTVNATATFHGAAGFGAGAWFSGGPTWTPSGFPQAVQLAGNNCIHWADSGGGTWGMVASGTAFVIGNTPNDSAAVATWAFEVIPGAAYIAGNGVWHSGNLSGPATQAWVNGNFWTATTTNNQDQAWYNNAVNAANGYTNKYFVTGFRMVYISDLGVTWPGTTIQEPYNGGFVTGWSWNGNVTAAYRFRCNQYYVPNTGWSQIMFG